MANREILTIEIDDSEFEAFRKKFSDYQSAVNDMPKEWAEANRAMSEARTPFEQLNELIEKQNELIRNLANGVEGLDEPIERVSTSWGTIYRYGRLFGTNIANSTLSLAKWAGLTSVFSAILSAGGLYGLNRMAESVSNRRTTAASLGTTIGAREAFITNFGRIGNAENILGRMSSAISEQGNYALAALGVQNKIKGLDAPHAFAAILPDIERLIKSTRNMPAARLVETYDLESIGLGVSEIRTLRTMADTGELGQMRKGFAESEGPMNIASAKAFADFDTALQRAEGIISKVFSVNVINLLEPSEKLTEAVTNFTSAILRQDGVVDVLLKDLGEGIDSFSKMLEKEVNLAAIKDQVDLTGRQFGALLDWIEQHDTLMKTVFGALVGAAAGSIIPGVGTFLGGVAGAIGGAATAEQDRKNKATWDRLRHMSFDPSKVVNADPDPVVNAASMMGAEEHINNEDIKQYLRTGGIGMDPAKVPWCAAFVNASLAKSGIKGTGTLSALSFREWGQPVTGEIHRGDVFVKPRGAPGQGHVGLLTGNVKDGQAEMISGNLGDKVSTSWENVKAGWVRRATPDLMSRSPAKAAAKSPSPVQIDDQTNGSIMFKVAH